MQYLFPHETINSPVFDEDTLVGSVIERYMREVNASIKPTSNMNPLS